MKLMIALFSLTLFAPCSEAQSLRERIRERVKERMAKREEAKPAPETNVSSEEKITKPGDYTLSFSHNGITRMYKLHVPSHYTGAEVPLLIALHGGGGDMSYQSNDKLYKQISKSEELGFIVAFPNGYSKFNSGKFATWNAGKCCGDARDKNIDDVGFIKEMIAKISSQLNVDKNKIFATGMSNGGMMAYRLACELSDTIKGIAAVAGTDNTINCAPKNPISILHIHAKNDDHVLFNGGSGKSLSENKEKVTEFVSVPATVAKWVKQNECSDTPKRVLDKNGAYCDLYSGCKSGTKVQLCVTDTGAHSWPGGEKIRRGAQETSKAISANDVMWEFFLSK
nr:poly(3-hydroxybutyrate) depolymerase [Bacteriovorax sp. HI3]